MHRLLRRIGLCAGLTLILCSRGATQLDRVAPGDRLTIAVTGEENLSRVYVVDEEGKIQIDQVGQLPVSGLTLPQTRDLLQKRLSEYLLNPEVRVELTEKARLLLIAAGQFARVGPLTLTRGARLLDAYAATGGLAPDANDQHLRVQRRGQNEPILVDLAAALQGNAAQNIELKDGDHLYLPKRDEKFFRLLGAVREPREYVVKPRLRLLEAIITAGGITDEGDRQRILLTRVGQREPVAINPRDILDGKIEEPEVQPGDVIVVPVLSRVTVALRGAVTRSGHSALVGRATLRDALSPTLFAPEADRRRVQLIHRDGEIRVLNLEEPDGADYGLPLQDGDEIFVPSARVHRVLVVGGVRTPGPQSFTDRAPLLSEAIGLAGGLTEHARKEVVVLRSPSPGEQPQFLKVNWGRFLSRRDPQHNPALMANDIVVIEERTPRARGSFLEGLIRTFAFGGLLR